MSWLLLAAALTSGAIEEPLSAAELIAASNRFHDPDGRWAQGAWAMDFDETRPEGGVRKSTIEFDNAAGRFELTRTIEAGRFNGRLTPNGFVEGVTVVSLFLGGPLSELTAI